MDKKLCDIIIELRKSIDNYRNDQHERGYECDLNPDIGTIEIAIALIIFRIQRKREILDTEKWVFNAEYYLSYGFENTEWEDIYIKYVELVNYANLNNLI